MRRISARAERADGEIGAAEPKSRDADQNAKRRRHARHRRLSARNERHTIRPRAFASTNAPRPKKAAWPRLICPRIAAEQVPALSQGDGEEDLHAEIEQIVARR